MPSSERRSCVYSSDCKEPKFVSSIHEAVLKMDSLIKHIICCAHSKHVAPAVIDRSFVASISPVCTALQTTKGASRYSGSEARLVLFLICTTHYEENIAIWAQYPPSNTSITRGLKGPSQAGPRAVTYQGRPGGMVTSQPVAKWSAFRRPLTRYQGSRRGNKAQERAGELREHVKAFQRAGKVTRGCGESLIL